MELTACRGVNGYNIYWSPSFFSHLIVWMLCVSHACYPTNHYPLDYIKVASLSVCTICLTKPFKCKTLHWSDKSFVDVLESECVCACVCVSVCVWQWPLASNCLFPVQTNKAGEGEGEDGISLMYIYTVSETTRQMSWVQWHKISTQLWIERQHELLTLMNWEEIHEYTIVLANGDHFKGHTHCCLEWCHQRKQEHGSACYI